MQFSRSLTWKLHEMHSSQLTWWLPSWTEQAALRPLGYLPFLPEFLVVMYKVGVLPWCRCGATLAWAPSC